MPELFCSWSAFFSCSSVMSPSRTRMSPSLSGVAAAVAVRNSLELKHLKYFPGTGGSRLCDKRPDCVQQFRTNSRHAVEPLETPERAVLGAPSDDALRERRSDARQTRDLRHVGPVQIDSLAGRERAGETRGAPRRLAQVGAARRRRRLKLDVARGRLRRG